MQPVQVDLTMTEMAAAGIATGKFVLSGGVVRDAVTGQIIEHLKQSSNNMTNDAQPVLEVAKNVVHGVKESTFLSLGKKVAAGTLIVAGLVGVGYGTYKLVTFLKKQTKEKELKEIINQNNELIAYNPELTEYLNNLHSKEMSLSSIKKVVDFFETYSNGDLSIEITEEEMKVIRNLIIRYTIKLCKANRISLEDKQLAIVTKSTNKNDLIYEILYATNLQKEIFTIN